MWAKWRGVRDRAPVVAPKALLQISGVAYIVTGACGNVCQDIDVVKWHGLRLWGDVPGEGGRRAPSATPGHFFSNAKGATCVAPFAFEKKWWQGSGKNERVSPSRKIAVKRFIFRLSPCPLLKKRKPLVADIFLQVRCYRGTLFQKRLISSNWVLYWENSWFSLSTDQTKFTRPSKLFNSSSVSLCQSFSQK